MRLDVSKETYEAKWYDFNGCRLRIRPYGIGQGDIVFRDNELVQRGEDRWKMFDYSLVAWEGVTDQNGEKLALTAEVKRRVFDFGLGGIATFVILKNSEFLVDKQDQEKN